MWVMGKAGGFVGQKKPTKMGYLQFSLILLFHRPVITSLMTPSVTLKVFPSTLLIIYYPS